MFIILRWFSFGQITPLDTTKIKHVFLETGGLVSYYFWETDSLNHIKDNLILKPFIKNYVITSSISNRNKTDLSIDKMQRIVNLFAHDVTGVKEKTHFEFQDSLKKEKIIFGLKREIASKQESVVFIKKNNDWSNFIAQKVMYFTVDHENKWTFSKTSDSIILEKHNIHTAANGPYVVITYLKHNQTIREQLIYTYAGQDVTSFFKRNHIIQAERVLIFINGYRGPTREKDETDHLVTSKDRYYYWFKIDDQFISRLEPSKAYYLDGSMSIKTSNHRSMRQFAKSMFFSTYIFRKKKARDNYNRLNTKNNKEGFYERKEKGKIGGRALLAALCNSPACFGTMDTLDIVCHSMGYAYTLGLIEELKGKVVFGKIYILAPENACEDGADWSQFEQVWQYGSNLGEKDADPLWEQDGIAPQCAVKGIEQLPSNSGGRAFFPKDWKRKNFIDSHQLYNYDWIFERIQKVEIGFISK
ncbi:MAG: hypothetical protein HYR91_03915 [Flavobacteriia bacterium]|nr:hypothetical protein [Flavobacteriia bacterium]